MKKLLTASLAALMVCSLASCSSSGTTSSQSSTSSSSTASSSATSSSVSSTAQSSQTTGEDSLVMMATTTSTDDSGLLDYLAPLFQEDTGYELQWTAVGTGDAIQKGMDGEVDVILVHAKEKEEAFVNDGYGVERFEVMYNDFVIVGPKDGPVAYSNDINAVFSQIKNEELTFVSRGDNSGTHTKELGVWSAIGVEDYEANPNYVSAGAGMADTLVMADEMGGYCLTDRGTWLAKQADFPNMAIVCEGDANLLNQYGVIAVSAEKYPDTNLDGANAFIDWICSDEIQTVIGEYGVDQYGEPLFFPNAK